MLLLHTYTASSALHTGTTRPCRRVRSTPAHVAYSVCSTACASTPSHCTRVLQGGHAHTHPPRSLVALHTLTPTLLAHGRCTRDGALHTRSARGPYKVVTLAPTHACVPPVCCTPEPPHARTAQVRHNLHCTPAPPHTRTARLRHKRRPQSAYAPTHTHARVPASVCAQVMERERRMVS